MKEPIIHGCDVHYNIKANRHDQSVEASCLNTIERGIKKLGYKLYAQTRTLFMEPGQTKSIYIQLI